MLSGNGTTMSSLLFHSRLPECPYEIVLVASNVPEARGLGLGKALLAELARIAVARGCARLEWWVLDWNEPSIAFYKSLGAKPMDEWTVMRVDGAALVDLASTE